MNKRTAGTVPSALVCDDEPVKLDSSYLSLKQEEGSRE